MNKSLFDGFEKQHQEQAKPLAARMRPRTLQEFCGQRHLLESGALLQRLMTADRLGSVILYGPPGTGKTTLARLLAGETRSHFVQLSAVTSGVRELRPFLEQARDRLAADAQKTLLFIDEMHRFNKAQQDALLHDVEDGIISLVGATTSNPFFAVNGALVSRSQVFEFRPLDEGDILELLLRALRDPQRGLGQREFSVESGALELIARRSDGDARRALNVLEVAVLSSSTDELSRETVAASMQHRLIDYDRDGDAHFDTISALIKSIRGSDPDAALYWLAKMLAAGEDVRFLTRRLVILASEDIGNADPAALSLAVATMQACEFVGLPECQLTLSQAVTYLACAPKSNAATEALAAAQKDIAEGALVPVPRHLRDSHYAGAKRLGHGTGYQSSHGEDDGIAAQEYLGIDRVYYRPVPRGFEHELAERLEVIRRRLRGDEDCVEF